MGSAVQGIKSEGPERSSGRQNGRDFPDVTHLQSVGQNDVGVHGPHV